MSYKLEDFIHPQAPAFPAEGEDWSTFINWCIGLMSWAAIAEGGYTKTLVIDRKITIRKPIRLRSFTNLLCDGGGFVAEMKPNLPLFYTGTDEVVQYAGFTDMIADVGVSDLLWLSSSAYGDFSFERVVTNSKTNVLLKLAARSTAGLTPTKHGRNIVANTFSGLITEGECGTGVLMAGFRASEIGLDTYVTLNTFKDFNLTQVAKVGYNFARWTDNNTFNGNHRVALTDPGSRGAIVNSSDPANIVGVYTNCFHTLAVDAFGQQGTNRTLMEINNSRTTTVEMLFGDRWDGSAVSIHPSCRSYSILHVDGKAGYKRYGKGLL